MAASSQSLAFEAIKARAEAIQRVRDQNDQREEKAQTGAVNGNIGTAYIIYGNPNPVQERVLNEREFPILDMHVSGTSCTLCALNGTFDNTRGTIGLVDTAYFDPKTGAHGISHIYTFHTTPVIVAEVNNDQQTAGSKAKAGL